MNDIKILQGILSLGKNVEYAQQYSSDLLCALARSDSRELISLASDNLPFDGVDIWTAYELSWLDLNGKPVVAYGIFTFPCQSSGMIESKSFKLYLNSFNQTRFSSLEEVKKTLSVDLSSAVQDKVVVDLFSASVFDEPRRFMGIFPGDCIDDLPVVIDEYQPNPDLLEIDDVETGIQTPVQETLHSHLLRTNCPVTSQPDWASIRITYRGPKINRTGLLKYICSYRLHADFHEQCIERIFKDLLSNCLCTQLTIEARFLRRGGLDINPFRTNCNDKPLALRLLRQ